MNVYGRAVHGRNGLVGSRRSVVDARYVDGNRVRSRIEIDAAVGGSAVVLHLEREGRVGTAVGVGRRVKVSLPAVMSVTLMNCPAVTAAPLSFNVPCAGRRGDFHPVEVVRRVVVGIGEAEVGRRRTCKPCPPAP